MKITVEKSYHNPKQYTVQLTQGAQSFRLDYTRPKRDAKWLAEMLEIALRHHDEELREEREESKMEVPA